MRPGESRLSVNLPDEIVDSLKDAAARRGVFITEALRQAISMMLFFDEEKGKGSKILIEDSNGMTRQVFFL